MDSRLALALWYNNYYEFVQNAACRIITRISHSLYMKASRMKREGFRTPYLFFKIPLHFQMCIIIPTLLLRNIYAQISTLTADVIAVLQLLKCSVAY